MIEFTLLCIHYEKTGHWCIDLGEIWTLNFNGHLFYAQNYNGRRRYDFLYLRGIYRWLTPS